MSTLYKAVFDIPEKKIDLSLSSSGLLGITGLRHRMHLPSDEGVFFDLGSMGLHAFWMESVYIPIDIIFIDEGHTVVDIYRNAIPLSKNPMWSSVACRYAIEVNAGWVDEVGVSIGTIVKLLGHIPLRL